MCEKEKIDSVIRSGTLGDYEAIELLCNERFGLNYVNREVVAEWTRHPEFFLVTEQGGDFAGFSVFVPHTPGVVAQHMAMPLSDVLNATGGMPPLICKSVVIVPKFEHSGLMKAMLSKQLETAKELGFGAVFSSAWEHNGIVPMAGLFQRLGFEKLYLREMLWYDIKDYVCVICGGPCVCNAVIYQKKLRGGHGI